MFDRVAKNFDADYVFQSMDALLTAEEQKKAAERTKPWGTIHAVLCAKEKLHEPFAVINADDYYGRSAFETLGKYLSSIDNDCTEHAMVGYILGNTMSRNGSVSRGVAQTKDGYLESIVENTKIYYTGKNKTFPSTIALNKLYYFMPYIKEKGVRDIYLIKTIRIGNKAEIHPESGDKEPRLVFELEYLESLAEYEMITLYRYWYKDTFLAKILKGKK